MAKVKKAQNVLRDVMFHLSKITDDNLTSVFHLEAFDKGQLDEKTVEVIRGRVLLYLQNDVYKIFDALRMLGND